MPHLSTYEIPPIPAKSYNVGDPPNHRKQSEIIDDTIRRSTAAPSFWSNRCEVCSTIPTTIASRQSVTRSVVSGGIRKRLEVLGTRLELPLCSKLPKFVVLKDNARSPKDALLFFKGFPRRGVLKRGTPVYSGRTGERPGRESR